MLKWGLCFLFISTSIFAVKFKDVPTDHWGLAAIDKLVSMGVIDGYEDGTFRGRKTVTRYELALYLSNVSKIYEKKQVQQAQQIEALQRQVQALKK